MKKEGICKYIDLVIEQIDGAYDVEMKTRDCIEELIKIKKMLKK